MFCLPNGAIIVVKNWSISFIAFIIAKLRSSSAQAFMFQPMQDANIIVDSPLSHRLLQFAVSKTSVSF
jgi:hypothetical protein